MTDRRAFLKGVLATGGALTLAPGLFLVVGAEARPAGQAANPHQRWGLLIDTGRCRADCTSCIDACRREQGWSGHGRPASDPQWIRKVEATDPRTGASASLPVMCQHCAHPPCAEVCPTGASFRRDDGIVLVDRHLCIGCRYCLMACPFKARSFVHEDIDDQREHTPRGKGTAEGCTLCVHRIDAGQLPACVEACRQAGAAMVFGDLNDPDSVISRALHQHHAAQLRPDLKLDNGVQYLGL